MYRNCNKQNSYDQKIISNCRISSIDPRQPLDIMKQEFGSTISYNTAFKAIKSQKMQKKLVLRNSYSYLNSLAKSCHRDETIFDFEIENSKFKGMFLTWNACKKFYDCNRKIIEIDGTFLSGPHKGTLSIAVL